MLDTYQGRNTEFFRHYRHASRIRRRHAIAGAFQEALHFTAATRIFASATTLASLIVSRALPLARHHAYHQP